MATKTTTDLTCDMPGGHVHGADAARDVETVRFSVGGRRCEMELCRRHRTTLRAVLESFTPYARRVRPPATPPGRRTRRDRARSAEIREWARQAGYYVGDIGRIPVLVLARYEEEHRAA